MGKLPFSHVLIGDFLPLCWPRCVFFPCWCWVGKKSVGLPWPFRFAWPGRDTDRPFGSPQCSARACPEIGYRSQAKMMWWVELKTTAKNRIWWEKNFVFHIRRCFSIWKMMNQPFEKTVDSHTSHPAILVKLTHSLRHWGTPAMNRQMVAKCS